ncbi:MAG: hypothetical protein LBB98_13180 [Treponema sp.]|nr:hypothetical protein [Treponema sp.]
MAGFFSAAYSSDNGETWTQLDNYPGTHPRDITYANGKFVAAGEHYDSQTGLSPMITYSTDGVTWKEVKDCPFEVTSNIAYDGKKFVVAGGV